MANRRFSSGSVKEVSAGNKDVPVKRRVYRATLDKIHNTGNLTEKRCLDSQNYHNLDSQVSVRGSVIFPIEGRFKRIIDVSLPAYISDSLATHSTTTQVDLTLQVDHLLVYTYRILSEAWARGHGV